MLFWCGTLLACGPHYWVEKQDWPPRTDTVAATDYMGRPVRLRSEKLDGAKVLGADDGGVHVRPGLPRFRAALGLLAVGTILSTLSIGVAAFRALPGFCGHGEVCGGPTVASISLGSVAVVSLIIGSSLLPSGLREAEVR
jgi:hypothetical protein